MNINPLINIYFYSPGHSMQTYGSTIDDQPLYVNTVPVFLNSYIKKTDPDFYKRLTWSKIVLTEKTQDQLVEEITTLGVNVVCLSLYFWNNEQILEISKGLKQRLGEEILILAGGPSVSVVRDPAYVKRNSDFDYTIYAQGEKPFYDILRNHFDQIKLSVLSTKNCAWVDNNGNVKKADYEFYRLNEGSPYIESRHLLEQIVADPENSNCALCLPYETSKGCPYNCSFCDWTSGLSHKVSKRRFVYDDELEMFKELGLTRLYLSDANFGLHKEDKGIMESLATLNKNNGPKFTIISANFSKTKKDQVYDLLEVAIANNLITRYKCSVQDIHPHILENIERPDIPWNDQLVYIRNLIAKFPEIETNVLVELIQGMPGQTKETWENTLFEISSQGFSTLIFRFIIISNSPAAYDQEWQSRMQLKTAPVKLEDGKINEAVVGTYSFNEKDFAYFNFLTNFYLELELIDTRLIPNFRRLITLAKEHADFPDFMCRMHEIYDDIPSSLVETKQFFDKIIKYNVRSFSKTDLKILIKSKFKHQLTVA